MCGRPGYRRPAAPGGPRGTLSRWYGALLFQAGLTHSAATGRCRRVSLVSRHDGTFHEDVPLSRERIDITDSALGGQPFDVAANFRQMPDGGLVNRVLPVVNFDHRGQESAALEIRLAEPPREHIKDCQQLFTGSFAAALAFRLQPVPGPELLTAAQEIEDQVILGRKGPVKGHLRRACLGNDGIHADRTDTFAAEQLVRRPADPLAPAVLPVFSWLAHQSAPVSHCCMLSLSEDRRRRAPTAWFAR